MSTSWDAVHFKNVHGYLVRRCFVLNRKTTISMTTNAVNNCGSTVMFIFFHLIAASDLLHLWVSNNVQRNFILHFRGGKNVQCAAKPCFFTSPQPLPLCYKGSKDCHVQLAVPSTKMEPIQLNWGALQPRAKVSLGP